MANNFSQLLVGISLQVTQAQTSNDNPELILDISDDQKSQYLNQDFDSSELNTIGEYISRALLCIGGLNI